MSSLDKYLKYADLPTPKPASGTWRLIAPDGATYTGESPIACIRAEAEVRIPAHIALGRIARAMDEEGDE